MWELFTFEHCMYLPVGQAEKLYVLYNLHTHTYIFICISTHIFEMRCLLFNDLFERFAPFVYNFHKIIAFY